jgi:hypothetical protein
MVFVGRNSSSRSFLLSHVGRGGIGATATSSYSPRRELREPNATSSAIPRKRRRMRALR